MNSLMYFFLRNFSELMQITIVITALISNPYKGFINHFKI